MKQSEEFFTVAFYVSIAGIVLTVYFSVVFAQQMGNVYYLLLLAIPLLIAAALYFRKAIKRAKALNYINREWGKIQKRKRNLKKIPELFKVISEVEKERFFIDDQTWQDLTMDEIYAVLDRTLTNAGEEVLYSFLRFPSFDKEEIKKRGKIIDLFRRNIELRQKIQFSLYNLGRIKNNGLVNLLWSELPSESPYAFLFYFMSVCAVISLISLIPLGIKNGSFLIILVFLINFAIHAQAKKLIQEDLASIGRIGTLITTAQSLKGIEDVLLEEKLSLLRNSSNICSGIAKKTFSLGRIEGVDFLADYLNIFFLIEEVSFFSVIKGIRKHVDEIKNIYMTLGELDTYISLASYREGLNGYVEPEFYDNDTEVSMVEGRHPLLENAVPNSINLHRGGIILTGSNMSGKSTFLRTLGVNALLAQTIATCTASSYKASLLKVMTSISPTDDITGGKSYYLGEAEALLRIIRSCKDKIPSLCIIDEIFRGTNPVERISAAAEILDYLPDHNAITVVATHDIELTDLVKNHYECYYFTEDVGEKGLIFDYKIRKGISKTRNAIKVLKFIGYPEEIIQKANERIELLQK